MNTGDSCEFKEGNIFLYAEDPDLLSSQEKANIEEHLYVCTHCRKVLEIAKRDLTIEEANDLNSKTNLLLYNILPPIEENKLRIAASMNDESIDDLLLLCEFEYSDKHIKLFEDKRDRLYLEADLKSDNSTLLIGDISYTLHKINETLFEIIEGESGDILIYINKYKMDNLKYPLSFK